MLSKTTLNIVKSTAPVLAEHGEAITQRFYSQLFRAHPELKHIFNPAHQNGGAQSRALAESVFLYAQHIDRLEALGPLVNRIAHKHASVQVAPEHYPVVGLYLLKAIQEHLQLQPQDPILGAWAEAYDALAQIFIQTEETIYSQNAEQPGGWRGFRSFIVDRIEPEAEGIKSFYLVPADGQAIAPFQGGQYVGLQVQVPHTPYRSIRQYSLSGPSGADYYRITVKNEQLHPEHPGQVSSHLHQLQIGDQVKLQPPTGDFTLKSPQKPTVFIAGGVGITPLLSMLLNRIQDHSEQNEEALPAMTFIQCCRSARFEVMGQTLSTLSQKHGFTYKLCLEKGPEGDAEGYLKAEHLQQWLPQSPDTEVYFCGPRPFMQALNTLLQTQGFSAEQLHYEVFGPTTAL